jgi:(1->4)-alpha-D-glucan 1-alpha-D-glucosylmutase
MLWELYTTNDEIKQSFDENIAQFNGRPGDPESFNALDRLLGQQYYRLSFWKVATEEINYRRFFNINDLISLRIEDARVFDATHILLSRLIRESKITGLRIDHIDGLYDPVAYLKRLREISRNSYMIVEKILSMEERLPADWPISGTTGYDFTNHVNGLFCRSKNEGKLSDFYARFTGLLIPYGDLVTEKKRLIIGRHMAGDVDRLANLLKRISSTDRFGGDITLYGLKRALVEVLTFFPVYRTYITSESFSAEDRRRIGEIMNRAKEMNPALLHELAFIEKFLLLEHGEHTAEEERAQWVHFIMRLQQLTGPLMAKGFEDTTLYLYNRLLSLNEVGGNPGQFGVSLKSFHQFNDERFYKWPHSLNATSTHDTKRGEDVRARINVLSEIPDEWQAQVLKWSAVNSQHKQWLKGREVPDRNDEYFLYQSLIGVWPLTDEPDSVFLERVQAYMIKAVREAKVHTEWLKPDAAYEGAFLSFIDAILRGPESGPFLAEFLPFARKVRHFGALNSLAQTLLKITSPGVPDFYQGTELWDLNFVDPDNRRPVDFDERRKLLNELRLREKKDLAGLLYELTADPCSSRLKLYVTYKGLALRQSQKSPFEKGEYIPLYAVGPREDYAGAFARHDGAHWGLTIVPRFLTEVIETGALPLGKSMWLETKLALPEEAPDRWVNVFTNETLSAVISRGKKLLPLSDALQKFPLALLVENGSRA